MSVDVIDYTSLQLLAIIKGLWPVLHVTWYEIVEKFYKVSVRGYIAVPVIAL